jgi:hypothetical protein
MESSVEVPQKLKIELLHDPAILFLGMCLKECKSEYNKDTCTPMFTAALYIISKLREQPRCPTTYEWIEKILYTHAHTHTHTLTHTHTHTQYHSAIKKDEILSFTSK